MTTESNLGLYVKLPTSPPGWFDHAYSVLADGSLAILRTRTDIHAEYARLRERARAGAGDLTGPDLRSELAHVWTFDGTHENSAFEASFGFASKLSRFSDGRWLLVGAPAEEGNANARVLDQNGTQIGAFNLGDGINHVRCAPDGTIWVGYFDEGVFASSGEDGVWPVSNSGIAQFGSDGELLWKYNTEEGRSPSVDDCYAMTLDGNDLWSCFYSDFPIARVAGGEVQDWTNVVSGARALAVAGEYVLLAGGYNEKSGRIALVRLGDREAEFMGEIQTRAPSRQGATLWQGQGDTLHIVDHGVWQRLRVATLRIALGI